MLVEAMVQGSELVRNALWRSEHRKSLQESSWSRLPAERLVVGREAESVLEVVKGSTKVAAVK